MRTTPTLTPRSVGGGPPAQGMACCYDMGPHPPRQSLCCSSHHREHRGTGVSGPSCGLWGSVHSARGGLFQLEVGLSP